MTVISLLDLRIKPDLLDSAPEVIHSVLAATRAREGSLGVEVTVDADDRQHFIVVEKWESMEADDAYREWRSTPEGVSDLGSLLAAPPVLTRTVVTDI
ncbi:putative quinol monooxygenase [Herbiconiux flava]|uniref:Quinol monooxygenase YgiN n=1 Tax=Herbiconiux flava TaxID=881268 RepID=A0A852SKU4_9MICO|nr:antibiotic biosynthesis monooxygenase [Herbiconiux flava]NYD69121.1 quinol monooxygenase YgiN [Herbiconiux flava]GLK15869.1 antibiotic biosynthesis monooxygenase [Herbiconiux flava]